MATTIGTAYVQILPTIDGFANDLQSTLTGQVQAPAESAGEEAGGSLAGGIAKGVAAGAAAVTAAASAVLAGTTKMVTSVAASGDEIDKQSQKLGLSTSAYQEWDYVLNLAGTSMSNMGTGLKTLTNKLDDAKNGSTDAQEMFAQLGLSMDDLSTMSREDIFSATIAGFQNLEDSTERAALANDLFGKSGQELTPLFNMTNEATTEAIQNINDLGGVMSEDAVAASADFTDAMTTLKATFGGFVATIGTELMPVIVDVMNMIIENMPQIKEAVGPVIETIGGWVSDVATWISTHGDTITAVINGISSTISVVWTAVSAILSSLKTAVSTVSDSIGGDGIEIEDVFTGIQSVITTVANIVCPIIELVGTAIGALVKEAQTDGTLINTVWENIQTVTDTVFTAIGGIIDTITALLNGDFSGAFEAASGVVDTVVGGMWTIVSNNFGFIYDKVSGVVDFLKGCFNFSWSLPDIKLPHFSITGSFSLSPPSIPSVSVSWWSKGMDEAQILTNASVFGMAGGRLQAGGEAGNEVVVGESHLIDLMDQRINASFGGTMSAMLALMERYMPGITEQKLVIAESTIADSADTEIQRRARREAAAFA